LSLAFSVPVVIAGVATTQFGLHRTSLIYCAVIAVLAAAAAGSLIIRRQAAPGAHAADRAGRPTMTASASIPVVNLNDHAAAVAYLMRHAGAIALVVLDSQRPSRSAGVITRAGIIRAAAAGKDPNNVRIPDLLQAGKKKHGIKAVAINGFGGPPSLHNLPVPEPGEGEMLVRVRASSVNGFDVSVANGHLQGMIERRFPVVLGRTSPAPSRQPVPA
jgi:hypothetical protein